MCRSALASGRGRTVTEPSVAASEPKFGKGHSPAVPDAPSISRARSRTRASFTWYNSRRWLRSVRAATAASETYVAVDGDGPLPEFDASLVDEAVVPGEATVEPLAPPAPVVPRLVALSGRTQS